MKSVRKHLGWASILCIAVLALIAGTAIVRAHSSTPYVQYRSAQGTGLARAYCQSGETLTGGGGYVSPAGWAEVSLRQSHPISDTSGSNAYGSTGIGWQVASSDFEDTVVAFAICASP